MYEEDSQTTESGTIEGVVIIPVKIPHQSSSEEMVADESSIIRSILSGEDVETTSSGYEEPIKDQLAQGTLSFYTVSSSYEETASHIKSSSGISDEAITCAAKCGAFWTSLGVETLIYMSSYGGGLLANGLIIRFAGLNPLLGTLLFGSYSSISYHNARVLFTSLIKPPRDDLPEGKEETFRAISKYAFLPISWIVGSAISGTTLSLLGDASFGTQQAVGVPTSLMIGPVMGGLGAMTRECMGGSIDIDPDYTKFKDVPTAFRTVYSSEPNPLDDNRSRRYGMLRDVFLRFLSVNLGTITAFAYGGTQLATYCIGGRDEFLNATQFDNTTDVNDLLNEYCAGGQFTYAFRELGFSLCYGIGVLVVEPILTGLFNMVYDCFYPRQDKSSSDDEGRFEEGSFDNV